MRARRLMVVLVVPAVACLVLLAGGSVGLAKEGVNARLLTPLGADAAPGEQLTVAWVLAGTDEHGRRQPFNAVGVFVRLLSASGGRPTSGFATPEAHPQGRYDAHVVVPEGGIGAVQIGLRGTSDGASSDVLFPLEDDPFAAPARGSATTQEATSDNSLPAWPALALLAVLGAVIWRARWRTAAARRSGSRGCGQPRDLPVPFR
jgi:hypothetical protein